MSKILKQMLFEHVFEHDFSMKRNYSEPKIFNAGGDLKQRWYVYFSYRNPSSGKMERMPNIYVTQKFDKKERLNFLKNIKRNLSQMLKSGFNPLDVEGKFAENPEMSIEEAFDFALNLKKQKQSEITYRNYSSRIQRFKNWLYKNGFEKRYVSAVNRKVINTYLNEVLESSSPRNRDNTRLDLSSLFQVLADNEIIKENFVSKTKAVGSKPNKNKPFTSTQEKDILKYLEENHKEMSLFVQFVAYTFLRPVEVCRIKIKDIDLKDKTIHDQTKTGFKIKIIPEILLEKLPDLSRFDKESYLFGRSGFGQYWKASDNNRRDYYTKAFFDIKKHFGLGEDYGIYSFRHTFAIKLYNTFIKSMTPDEAESKLMSITGHDTRDALRKYLREINAYRPEDYSEHLK